jgi:LDH2 family malate/lactate/ureidoglycolate dehydrogenase
LATSQTVTPKAARAFVQALFTSAGMPASDARRVAEIMVLQEMRGVRTHGLRFIEFNLSTLKAGHMNPRPRRKILRRSGAVTVLDGDHGMGMIACMEAMEHAVRNAKKHGVGIGVVTNNHHFLSAAPYCLHAADNNMIGIAFSNTYPNTGYPGTNARAIGNGPTGFAVPTGSGFPMVFDAALTTSYGKLNQWKREGRSIPPAFLARDSQGQLTSDPQKVIDGGTPVPIGEYKGAGLLLLIETLTGVLGGGAFLSGILRPQLRKSKRDAESQFCLAIDVARFMPAKTFRARMKEMIKDLKSKPVAPGYEAILVPGERAAKSLKKTSTSGIVIEPDVEANLIKWAKEQGVKWPFGSEDAAADRSNGTAATPHRRAA